MTELVVLLDEDGVPAGTCPKAEVHTEDTPLHLAFSCHVYDAAGRVLLTRRALNKVAWPGVWTNAFCGHPAPGEAPEAAVLRRADYELGLQVAGVEPVLPDFRYWARDASGIVENEVCPVFRATTAADPVPRATEAAEWAWVEPAAAKQAVLATPFAFSPWLVLQVEQGVWG